MRFANVREVFEDECKDLRIDTRFVGKIKRYLTEFIGKKEDHIQFFGGHLLGVNRVVFTNSEFNTWFKEILGIENVPQLEEYVHRLPHINPDFKVSSNIFNISCVWVTHAIFKSPLLNDKEKAEAMINTMMILQCSYMTSLMGNHFPYLANRETMEAAYATLSLKNTIKIQGTWYKVLEYRAKDIISSESIHREVFDNMENDLQVVYLLNDSRSRLHEMIKVIHDAYTRAHNAGNKIKSTSDIVEFDGNNILKDKVNGLSNYKQYLRSIVTSKEDFIKEDLLQLIENIVHTMPVRVFRTTLDHLSEECSKSPTSKIFNLIDEILQHSFKYLDDNRNLIRNTVNLQGMVGKLKGVYMSSRSTDPTLLSIREETEQLVRESTGCKNENQISSVRTGIMLYVISRTYTKNHYG